MKIRLLQTDKNKAYVVSILRRKKGKSEVPDRVQNLKYPVSAPWKALNSNQRLAVKLRGPCVLEQRMKTRHPQ